MAKKNPRSETSPIKEEEIDDIVNMINPPSSQVFYYGVRHHSPLSAFYLQEAINEFKPEIILVEGPAESNDLIVDIVNDETEPPVAIYTYFTDKKNTLGYNGILTAKQEIPLRIGSWYPFTTYSPEYVALKEAVNRNIEVFFIDMPLELRLNHEKEIAPTKEFFQKYAQWSERTLSESIFMKNLIKKSKMRSFNEFWNHHFEVNAIHGMLKGYMKQIFTFAYIIRWLSNQDENYPAWKTIIEREKYIASNIEYYKVQNPNKKILVITGAFHSVALPFIKTKPKLGKIPKEKSSTLAPYSYRRVSDLSGYTAGIEAPFYQNLIWEEIKKEKEGDFKASDAFNQVALKVLIKIKEELQDSNNPVSTADTIHAFHLLKNLAALRARQQATLEDLRDAILATYVKGQVDIFGVDIVKEAQKILIGSKVGHAHNTAGNPLQLDFYTQLKTLKLPKVDEVKNVRCDIYKSETHRLKSQFLHQLVFLDVKYSKLKKGPDFIKKEHMELLTEQWEVRWSPRIDDAFPTLLPYGTTIKDVARNLLIEKIGESFHLLEELLDYLIISLQMGFVDLFEDLLQNLNKKVNTGQDFNTIVKTLSTGILLLKYRSSLIPKDNKLVKDLVYITFSGAIVKLNDLINLPEEQIEEAVLSCRILNQIALDVDLDFISSDILIDSVKLILNSHVKIVPRIEGAFIGMLYSFHEIGEKEIVRRFKGRILSNENVQDASEFLIGLLLLNKTILITSDHLFLAIHESLIELPQDLFLTILPGLRKAFTALIPREINYLGGKLAQILGIKPDLDLGSMDPVALAILQNIDENINSKLQNDWGI